MANTKTKPETTSNVRVNLHIADALDERVRNVQHGKKFRSTQEAYRHVIETGLKFVKLPGGQKA